MPLAGTQVIWLRRCQKPQVWTFPDLFFLGCSQLPRMTCAHKYFGHLKRPALVSLQFAAKIFTQLRSGDLGLIPASATQPLRDHGQVCSIPPCLYTLKILVLSPYLMRKNFSLLVAVGSMRKEGDRGALHHWRCPGRGWTATGQG